MRKLLLESLFNPKDPLWQMVWETGNYDYFLLRAMEEIQLARQDKVLSRITKAITLLLMAKLSGPDQTGT